MTSEQIRQRSDLLGTQVITRNTGKRLGVISQIWVDVDRREVVAFGLRESILSGVLSSDQKTMLLDSVRQIGDVILVDDDSAIEDDVNVEAFSSLIGCEVITETGELLGKVRGFKFDAENGELTSIVIASLGLPFIPDQVVSTYELSIEEVVSSGPDRLIVFEGAEQKMMQISVGLLERMGIGKPPWERMEDEYIMPTPVSNQLGTGVRETAPAPVRTVAPARETWDDDAWEEPAARPMREPLRQRQAEPEYYEGDGGWQEAPEAPYKPQEAVYDVEYEDALEDDVWEDDDNPEPYRAPQVNIPERQRVVEYEEEDY
ncbi:PRC-barrel domain-containing protein [Leptolyngbya sp. AN02str]|uniref:PRC-barrel domain-containing protein n=1 Tax=Leptolyngbya sp. AN02str TaxID=3423363 RepID=UPI003D31A27D